MNTKRFLLKHVIAIVTALTLLLGMVTVCSDFSYIATAATNRGSVAGYSFTISDIRDGSTHSFTGASGKTTVLIFGNLATCGNTQSTVRAFGRMLPYLNNDRVQVFSLDLYDEEDNRILNKANYLDPDKKVVISEYNDSFFTLLRRCQSLTGVGTDGHGYTFPFVVYIDASGNIYDFTTGYNPQSTLLEKLGEGGVEDTYSNRTVQVTDFGIEIHTQDEIRAFVNSHPINMNAGPQYGSSPSSSAPYNAGTVSSATLNDGLNAVNQVRYIAGLPHNVTIWEEYNRYAQSAALVNAANKVLSHFPTQPAGMDSELYSEGQFGARQSNLAMGFRSLSNSIISGYMYDGDTGNRAMLGHRRWVLNPVLGETGFGIVPDSSGAYYSAMYAFDNSCTTRASVSMWPAVNTPVEYFTSAYPWSFSTGQSEDYSTARVELTDKKTGRKWNFSRSSSDGYFNVNNGGYGLSGCVIFVPSGIDIKSGDQYSVKISGVMGNATVEYDVNFFNLYENNTDGENSETDNSGENDETDNSGGKGGTDNGGSQDESDNGGNENDGDNNDENNQERIDDSLREIEETINDEPETVLMYRLYNENNGEHFYTSDKNEAKYLVSIGWKYEDVAWKAPVISDVPVYRMYNHNSGEHHYTKSWNEVVFLYTVASGNNTGEDVKGKGWDYEKIGWYSAEEYAKPLYRLYNPNAKGKYEPGSHHYTQNTVERDYLISIGWNDEEIGWYGL